VGRRLYTAAKGPWRVARGAARAEEARRGQTRPRARIWLEVGDDPDRQAPPVSEKRRGGERGIGGWLGRGKRGKRNRLLGQLGRAGGREGRKKGRLGWAVWKRKKRGRERKEEKENGLGQEEKRRVEEKEMHPNAFKFEFKI
jgi:hypothetical protein